MMRGIFIKKKFPLLFAISALTSSAPLRPVFPILLGREVKLVEVRRLEMEGVVDMMLVEEVDMNSAPVHQYCHKGTNCAGIQSQS